VSYLSRIPYLAIFLTGAGLGSWWCGYSVGAAGVFLGMFSGADLYWSLHDRPRRFSLMVILAACGFGGGLLYEFLLSMPLALAMPMFRC
jgi:hypothetical protein